MDTIPFAYMARVPVRSPALGPHQGLGNAVPSERIRGSKLGVEQGYHLVWVRGHAGRPKQLKRPNVRTPLGRAVHNPRNDTPQPLAETFVSWVSKAVGIRFDVRVRARMGGGMHREGRVVDGSIEARHATVQQHLQRAGDGRSKLRTIASAAVFQTAEMWCHNQNLWE